MPRDDIFVASAALRHDVPVYAVDPHFLMIKEKGEFPFILA